MRTSKTFNCPRLLIHRLFDERTVALGENLYQRIYLLDGEHSMQNFNTSSLYRFSRSGKLYMHKNTAVKSPSDL